MREISDWEVHYRNALDAWEEEIKLRQKAEAEVVRLSAERDSVVGSYYTCRNVLQEANIPCQFGRDGEPTTDEGTGRDLADCVGTLVARLKGVEVERDALIETRIEPWRGGGYAVWLPPGEHPGGRLMEFADCPAFFHFDDRASAVAAIRVSAGLGGGGTG